DADDRLDAGVLRRTVELEGGEGIAMVCDSHGRHALRCRFLDQRTDPRGAVEHRVFAVHMQMYEGVGCHAMSLPAASDVRPARTLSAAAEELQRTREISGVGGFEPHPLPRRR